MTFLLSNWKAIGAFSLAIALGGAGLHFGDKKATEKYLPQIAKLETRIEVADEQARQTIIKQNENEIEISKELNDSVARINDRYERLLSEARNKTRSSTSANSSQEANGASAELQATIRFEQACALDANQIVQFQHWILLNVIPISE